MTSDHDAVTGSESASWPGSATPGGDGAATGTSGGSAAADDEVVDAEIVDEGNAS